MKTLSLYRQLLLLPFLIILILGLHSCVAPTDINGPGDRIKIDSPYVPAPLFRPSEVRLVLITEKTLRPNENAERPLWDNELDHRILIDTNKAIIIDSLGVPYKRRTLPRIYIEFTAVMKQNGAIGALDNKGYLLRKISLALPDTIDLENDEEVVYSKNKLPAQKNYFEYTYKEQQFVKAFVSENTSRLAIKAVKIEQKNRILIEFSYDVFPAVNGLSIPPERQHGSGRLIVSY